MGLAVVERAYRSALARLGVVATYSPTVGAPIATRAFVANVDQPEAIGGIDLQAPGTWLVIPQTDVPTRPAKGETVTIGADVYTIRTVHDGPQHAVWVIGTAEETP